MEIAVIMAGKASAETVGVAMEDTAIESVATSKA